MYGLSLSALVEEVDEAGYLGFEGSNGAQQARIECGAYCEGLAAEYLHASGSAEAAKQHLRADILQIGSATITGRLNDSESALFARFATLIDEAIDRLADKAGWQRWMVLWFFRTPRIIKILIVVIAITISAILFGRAIGK